MSSVIRFQNSIVQRRGSLIFLAVVLACFPSELFAERNARQSRCRVADSALVQASGIRKLDILQPVPCKMQSKGEVEKFLKEAITREVPREKIEFEGKVFKLLGLVPNSFRYFDGLVDLYTEQLAGYYEPQGKFYVMANWLPDEMQRSIAVHELTHALQDQHFNLSKFADEGTLSSDELLARTAVVEGDAMGVMMDAENARHGARKLRDLESVEPILATEIVAAATSSNGESPPCLEKMMLFPYLSGLRFIHTLLRRGDHELVDSAFLMPPESTEQVLHPDLFFRRKESSGFSIPEDAKPTMSEFRESEPKFSDTLGEFMVSTLLSQWIPGREAADAAAGWGGDRVNYFENAEKFLLVWRTHWDTDADAKEFYEALVKAYALRFEQSADKNQTSSVLYLSQLGRGEITSLGQDILFTLTGAVKYE